MTAVLGSPATTTSPGPHRLALTEQERAALAGLADQLSGTEPALVDHPDWLAQARRLSCHLPGRLLEALRRYRHDSGPDGILSIFHLPLVDDDLPATPAVPESVERAATRPAAVTMLLGLQLGEVIAFRDEKQGALVQNVVPVPSLAQSQSNAGSVELELHTENAFHPHRPDFIGLSCLRSDRRAEVGTLIAPVGRALRSLDERDRRTLHEARFVTAAPPSFRCAERTEPHPILAGCPDDPDLQVDFDATSALDETAARALVRLREALLAQGSALALRPDQMVFVDNRVAVHGRRAFAPHYDGQDRWLHRIFVHLDHRRSRARRPGNGPVVT